jgi:hypothetical protein
MTERSDERWQQLIDSGMTPETAAKTVQMQDTAAYPQTDAVVVAYVHNGQHVTYSWHHSMVELIGHDLVNHGRIMRGGYIAMRCETDGLVKARNQAAKLFLEERNADWLFWIDTDMGFPADTVEQLMAAADPVERPIVGGLAFTQREEQSDGKGGWRCRATPTVFDWLKLDDGQEGFAVRWDYQPDAVQRCAGTGSACILIHRTVFEKIHEKHGPTWYDRVPNVKMGRVVSEDLSFCMRAGSVGVPVHVHTGVKTTHQKTLWLSEDDYYGQVALSKIIPDVPPATERTAVIVPVMRRPQNAAPFMESLKASGVAELADVKAICDDADQETIDAWKVAGAEVIQGTWGDDRPGTFAEKVNAGYDLTTQPWLFITGDDVSFKPGWLDQAQNAARDGYDVIGTNDLHNPRVTSGEHATHLLIRRSYIDEQGASWDGPKVVAHEGYRHWFVDDEIVTAAKQRGTWVMAPFSHVEHLHPLWRMAPDDEVYQLGQAHTEADKALFVERRAANAR